MEASIILNVSYVHRSPQKEESSTHLKFNSSHLKSYFPKRKVIFQRSVFWGYVKLRVCISPSSNYQQASKETCANHNLRVENMLGCQIAKQKVRCTPEINSTSCIPKKESKSCSLAKKHSNAFNPERLSQMLRSFKPPSVHWRESIPSKHWCHATHRLPGASPKKSTAARLQLVPTPTLQACSPFPKKNSHLCGSFARTDAANEFTQFDGHGGATGPAGDPAVPPGPAFPTQRGWAAALQEVKWIMASSKLHFLLGGLNLPAQSKNKETTHLPFLLGALSCMRWVLNKERNGTWDVYKSSKLTKNKTQ